MKSDYQTMTPAEKAAQEALNCIFDCIKNHKSFILEAGAGAGKTYSLIHALKLLIKNHGIQLMRRNQKIACITYTNVAKDEIKARTDSHPVIVSETIHSFCWSLLKDFQPKLRSILPQLKNWNIRIEENGGIGSQTVKYDSGYPNIKDNEISLGHDDVLSLMVMLLKEPKFRFIFSRRFPILFIDEYQDTDKSFMDALQEFFIDTDNSLLIGFFGDHWQKIYGTGCGEINNTNLIRIGKRANFRSERRIVEALNRIRPELTQEISDPDSEGQITVFHTNNWKGQRRTEPHWKDDLPADIFHKAIEKARKSLEDDNWNFSSENTKILMLTHVLLATEQGYENLANVFTYNDSYIKKENDYIAYFVDVLEPVCDAYINHKYGEMFSLLKGKATIRKHEDKINWSKDMNHLLLLRQNGTISQVLEHLRETKKPRLTDKLEEKEIKFSKLFNNSEAEIDEKDSKFLDQTKKIKAVSYQEVIALTKFIEEKTPFSTKHGVKGAEFENVLVVFGKGWNKYNFNQMLEWARGPIPKGKEESFERNRNLFYVSCSRPKKRLALLFTHKLSSEALATISEWFGKDTIRSLDLGKY